MADWDTTEETGQEVSKRIDSTMSVDDVLKEFFGVEKEAGKIRLKTLIYGKDGSGKTGLGAEIIKARIGGTEKKAIVIDLDDYGGFDMTLRMFHPDIVKQVSVVNPLMYGDDGSIDKVKTFKKIQETCYKINLIAKKGNVDVVLFDGISNLLKMAEGDMRDKRNIQADGGVPLRHWLLRNQAFNDTIMSIHNLPTNIIYIGHENFIPQKGKTEDDLSGVYREMNRRCSEKIETYEEIQKNGDVKMYAQIHKNKFKPSTLGKQFQILQREHGKDNQSSIRWDPGKLLAELGIKEGIE